jgi:hypothetical protein
MSRNYVVFDPNTGDILLQHEVVTAEGHDLPLSREQWEAIIALADLDMANVDIMEAPTNLLPRGYSPDRPKEYYVDVENGVLLVRDVENI